MDRTIVNKVHQLFAVFLTSILSLFSLFSSNSIKINQKSYKIISQIGEGGFSYVFLVSDPSTGAKFALKRVRIQLPEHLTRVQAEIKAHSLVDNRHVIKLVDSWVGKTNNLEEGLLLLPFYKNGTLQNLIDQPGHITLARIIAISFDILSGLKAFHAKDLAYRDLKPHNIIFNDSDSAIIMDLGSVTRASIAINSRKDALAVSELCAETATGKIC